MKKIISLFVRSSNGEALNEIAEGAEWVANGEGRATRILAGECYLVRDGRLFKWEGGELLDDNEPVNDEAGWTPITSDDKQAFSLLDPKTDGIYDLVAPNGPEKWARWELVRRGSIALRSDPPRDHAAIRQYIANNDIEGIAWYHPDGRVAEVRGKDYGIKRIGA